MTANRLRRLTRLVPSLAATLAAGLGLSPLGQADILELKDGRVLDGFQMEWDEDFVVVHLVNGDLRVPGEMVQTMLDEEGAAFVPRTEEEREKYAEGLVPFEGKWIPIEKRRKAIEDKIEEQRERIAEDRAHATWGDRRFDETKNFLWEYTVPQHIIEAFQARCENYYEQFTKDWKVKRTGREKMRIRFFQSGREFNKTAAGGGGGALAYFVIIPPYEICIFYDRTSFEFTEMVLYHELSHYLQKLINQEFRIPHWPGEGVSEYYGGALWNEKEKELDIGLIQEGRLSSVLSQFDGGKRFSLVEMLSQPKYEDYSWGWTLVHFMMGDKRYKKGFQDYLKGIANDRKVNRIKMGLGAQIIDGIEPAESVEYFKKSLKLKSDEDVAEFEKEWYAYIDEELRAQLLDSVTGLEKAAVSALQDGKRLKAKRLFQEAVDAGSKNPTIYGRYASMMRALGEGGKARDLLRKAVELDPLEATYWWQLAEVTEDADPAEGERLKKLALELDPSVDDNVIDFSGLENSDGE